MSLSKKDEPQYCFDLFPRPIIVPCLAVVLGLLTPSERRKGDSQTVVQDSGSGFVQWDTKFRDKGWKETGCLCESQTNDI